MADGHEGEAAEGPLFEVARAIADRRPVDWAAAEAEAATPQDRGVIEGLRLIAEVSAVYEHEACSMPPRWGALLLRGRLGSGGYGTVYRAFDERLGREVALKLLEPEASGVSPRGLIVEGSLLARVRHPNVVVVHGADRHEGQVGIWMELVPGETLEALLRRQGPCSPREAANIGVEVCRALGAVHAAGLLHRDVKAENVMREHGGRIVLMDLGLGSPRDGEERGLSGTPAYLAPELLRGEGPPSVATDVFALGVLLFRLVTRRFPVEAHDLDGLREAHRARRRTWLPDVRPDVSPEYAAVVERALAPDPGERFESAGEMERALAAIAGERAIPRLGATVPRSQRAAALAAGVLACAVIGAVWYVSQPARPEVERASPAPAPKGGSSAGPGSPSVSAGGPVTEGRASPMLLERGDPFVRPLFPGAGLDPSPPSPRADAGLVIRAELRAASEGAGPGQDDVLVLRTSSPLWLYVLQEAEGATTLVFPRPGALATNPLEPERSHRLPLLSRGRPAPRDTAPFRVVLIGSATRLDGFEATLARARIPVTARGIHLDTSVLGALREALDLPWAAAPGRVGMAAPALRPHPELVRGTWIRRIDGRRPRAAQRATRSRTP